MSVERQVDYLMDELGAEILVVSSKEYADYGRSSSTQGVSLMKPQPPRIAKFWASLSTRLSEAECEFLHTAPKPWPPIRRTIAIHRRF